MYHRNILTLCMALLGFTVLSFTNPPEGVRVGASLSVGVVADALVVARLGDMDIQEINSVV